VASPRPRPAPGPDPRIVSFYTRTHYWFG